MLSLRRPAPHFGIASKRLSIRGQLAGMPSSCRHQRILEKDIEDIDDTTNVITARHREAWQ